MGSRPLHSRRVPGGLRNNKRSRPAKLSTGEVNGDDDTGNSNKSGGGGNSSSSSSEDEVAVVKADKRAKKGVNKFSTGGGGVGAEARAAARWVLREKKRERNAMRSSLIF